MAATRSRSMRRSSARCSVVLLLYPNEVVSTERLIDELWGERPPATAVKVVRTYVSQLRKVLGDDLISTAPSGLSLADSARTSWTPSVSAASRPRVTQSAASGDHKRAELFTAPRWRLGRGPPLADVTFESFARSEVERLEEERVEALT